MFPARVTMLPTQPSMSRSPLHVQEDQDLQGPDAGLWRHLAGDRVAHEALAQRVEITGSSIKRVEAEGALQVQTLTRTRHRTHRRADHRTAAADRLGNVVVGPDDRLRWGRASAPTAVGRVAARTGRGAHAGAAERAAPGGIRRWRRGLGERQQHSAGGDRAGRDPEGRRVGGLRLGCRRGRRELHPVKNFQGVQLAAPTGRRRQGGGGQQYQANIVAGWGDITKDNWNLTVSGQWNNNHDLFGKDRSFAKTVNNPPYTNLAPRASNIQGAWDLKAAADRLNGVNVPLTNPASRPVVAGYAGPGLDWQPAGSAEQCGMVKMAATPTPTNTRIKEVLSPASSPTATTTPPPMSVC